LATAVAYLAAPSSVIHPHDYYAKVGPKGMNERPIGTGPYRVVEHARGKYIRLERNPNYFKDGPKSQPRIDEVEIRFIPDAQTRVAEVVSGGVDLISRVSTDQAEQLRAVPNLNVVSGEAASGSYLQMNTLQSTPAPQLRDIKVRKAIMHAIDRETIARFLIGEGSRMLNAECHPSEFGCVDRDVPRYAYNPKKSRQLLKEAGFAKGFDIDLYAWADRNRAEAIMGYLSAVGIRARLRFLQFPALRDARRAGRAALVLDGWGSGSISDVSNSVSLHHEFSSDDVNRDAEVRDLLLRGDAALDPEMRKVAYAKALALIAERAYVVPLYSSTLYYVAARDLVFTPPSDNVLRFWEMYYK
jgi:peptide/nickel transport system substrate-binding protein